MPLKSIKKLSPAAKDMWESVFNKAKEKYGEERAAKIAWRVVKENFKTGRTGKKSIVLSQENFITGENKTEGTYVDVLLGLPTIDAQGEYLAESFWKNRPMGVIKGDMEHYYSDKAEGLMTEENPDYEGWVPVAQRFWNGENNELYARVELPENHPFTPTFTERWKSGDYGVSIEFAYPEEAIKHEWQEGKLVKTITEGAITGFTFTENPAIKETKNGN